VAFGASINNYPRLVAEYCVDLSDSGITPPSRSCEFDEDYIVEGSMLLKQVDLDSLTGYDEDGNEIVESDLSGVTLNIGNHAGGDEGRYIDDDENRCDDFADLVPGGCMAFHAEYFKVGPTAISSAYQYIDSEYFAIVFTTRGGRELSCDNFGLGYGHCYESFNATPGQYEITGTMFADIIFHDEVKLKTLPDNMVRLEYDNGSGIDIDTAILFVSTFVERE
ncbi:MAG: hypothetical protein AAF633_14365, partial [Chloroflexota bacterium]